jgi:aspartate/methionine/tyrosine aminotransferase
VIVIDPAYQSLTSIARGLGAVLTSWPLRSEHGFRADLASLGKLLGPRTRAVVVNFPHNPTGATLTRAEYQELLDLVRRHGCYLFWDGAFANLTYEEPPLPDPVAELPRCLSFGTLSKSYALPRVAYRLVPRTAGCSEGDGSPA